MGINFCPAYVDFPRFSERVLRVQWAPGATIMLNTGLCRAKANEARAATKKAAQKNNSLSLYVYIYINIYIYT